MSSLFRVTVRDHVMVAHSFDGEMFGPAQRLHGATYVVDATFTAESLDDNGVVLDIGAARDGLREVLGELDQRNLDDHPSFAGRNSTTEAVAQHIADRLADLVAAGRFGDAADRVGSVAVTCHESHVAWASYERAL